MAVEDLAPQMGATVHDASGGVTMMPDEFLAWIAKHGREYEGSRFELAAGRVAKMMINVTRGHAEVVHNLFRTLVLVLDPDKYLISCAEFGVRLSRSVRFPDLMVEPRNSDRLARATDNPIFIAEVLSPSTTAVDFLEKLPEYTSLPSLQTYLICSQDEPVAWLFNRRSDGHWPELPEEIIGTAPTIQVSGLKVNLPMSEIYRGIPEPGL